MNRVSINPSHQVCAQSQRQYLILKSQVHKREDRKFLLTPIKTICLLKVRANFIKQ